MLLLTVGVICFIKKKRGITFPLKKILGSFSDFLFPVQNSILAQKKKVNIFKDRVLSEVD